jgi:hypothetical protein
MEHGLLERGIGVAQGRDDTPFPMRGPADKRSQGHHVQSAGKTEVLNDINEDRSLIRMPRPMPEPSASKISIDLPNSAPHSAIGASNSFVPPTPVWQSDTPASALEGETGRLFNTKNPPDGPESRRGKRLSCFRLLQFLTDMLIVKNNGI